MNYKVFIKGIENKELNKIISNNNFNWSNFSEGDTVWIESYTHLPLPNLIVESIDGNTIILSA